MSTGPWTLHGRRSRAAEIESLCALEPASVTPDLHALLELALQLCGVTRAAINVLTEDEQHQIAAIGLEPEVCTSRESMCAVVLDLPTLSVGDATEDPRFVDNPFVDGRLDHIRFYASTPLTSARGVVIGRLCIFDPEPRMLTGDQEDALRVLAARVMDVLELRRRTRELEASNLRLSNFAGQVGHDLGSPLAAMLLYLELAQEEPEVEAGSTLRVMLERAASVTRRMSTQIDGVLRSAHHELPVDRRPVDLNEVVDFVLVDLAAALSAGGEVTREDLPVVEADPEQVYSLILNLVSNALKFTRPGVPARVHVSARRGESSSPGWTIDVADEGRGVSEAARPGVFQRHDRGEARDVVGHGIGLATARTIAESHGGTLTLHPSEPGTVLRLTLPDQPDRR